MTKWQIISHTKLHDFLYLYRFLRAFKHVFKLLGVKNIFFWRKIHFLSPLYFFQDSLNIRKHVSIPLVLLGGIRSSEEVSAAMENGFELIAMARALIHNPNFVHELQNNYALSDCTHCNHCIATMDAGGVQCVLHKKPAQPLLRADNWAPPSQLEYWSQEHVAW